MARAEACPGRFETPRGNLGLRICGFLDGGRITSTGSLKDSATQHRAWSAVGPSVRLTLDLGSRLVTELEPGLVLPVTRWTFTYKEQPNSTEEHELYRIPAYGWTLSWGLGYGFL